MNYKRLFLNWLKQNHIRQEFLHNCKTVRSAISTRHCYPIKYIWKEDPHSYIMNSFTWFVSDQGENFWRRYHDLWLDFLNDYIFTHHTL